ncbi:DUF1801 domain-containing protein [Winogradskyella sp. SYSU M77433]|uniref:DUF1801 domain-containing protein n=1 Tax=Winogradskyella sp. SYSU M77433 TaxID=3042722 RepID=UPI0024806A49|nr:DUF1801 domain-containing protein [Winogradskyella sp. SYSU M77433]MDH7913578.1 DUF1801 domain-containing protein [Winogradskyella sp. SYSU M77433]
MNPKVDDFLEHSNKWKTELETLRNLILECNLVEDFKWRKPCYTFQDKNIVIIGGLKNYCNISFLKGALLKDEDKILQKPGKNSRSARIVPFTSVEDILSLKTVLKKYIYEAIEIEKSGLKIETSDELEYPEELKQIFKENIKFKTAFENLTKGRQRGYLLHFSGAKQYQTRLNRIGKYTERIFDGKGMLDCVCGHSKKMPNCDGSHKYL